MHEGHRERMRQTYIQNGLDSFHDHQVLELLLMFSIPRRDTNPLAHCLLKRYGSLKAVLNAPIQDLMKVKGVGENTGVLLNLIRDVEKRMATRDVERTRLSSSLDAMRYCRTLFINAKYEALYVILLNKLKDVIHVEKISSGTITRTAVYPRLIIESALLHGAHSVILVHNHPSGEITASRDDILATKEVLKALTAIDITLNDHIIVSDRNAYSCLRDHILTESELDAETSTEEALVAEEDE